MTKKIVTTKVCRQCGGTEFASGYRVSVECVVDGSGRLVRFLEPDIEAAREACRSGMTTGPFECLSCGCHGKTMDEIIVTREHSGIDVCLIEKSDECGLNDIDIARVNYPT